MRGKHTLNEKIEQMEKVGKWERAAESWFVFIETQADVEVARYTVINMESYIAVPHCACTVLAHLVKLLLGKYMLLWENILLTNNNV